MCGRGRMRNSIRTAKGLVSSTSSIQADAVTWTVKNSTSLAHDNYNCQQDDQFSCSGSLASLDSNAAPTKPSISARLQAGWRIWHLKRRHTSYARDCSKHIRACWASGDSAFSVDGLEPLARFEGTRRSCEPSRPQHNERA